MKKFGQKTDFLKFQKWPFWPAVRTGWAERGSPDFVLGPAAPLVRVSSKSDPDHFKLSIFLIIIFQYSQHFILSASQASMPCWLVACPICCLRQYIVALWHIQMVAIWQTTHAFAFDEWIQIGKLIAQVYDDIQWVGMTWYAKSKAEKGQWGHKYRVTTVISQTNFCKKEDVLRQ